MCTSWSKYHHELILPKALDHMAASPALCQSQGQLKAHLQADLVAEDLLGEAAALCEPLVQLPARVRIGSPLVKWSVCQCITCQCIIEAAVSSRAPQCVHCIAKIHRRLPDRGRHNAPQAVDDGRNSCAAARAAINIRQRLVSPAAAGTGRRSFHASVRSQGCKHPPWKRLEHWHQRRDLAHHLVGPHETHPTAPWCLQLVARVWRWDVQLVLEQERK